MTLQAQILSSLRENKNSLILKSFDEATDMFSNRFEPYRLTPGSNTKGDLRATTTHHIFDGIGAVFANWNQPSTGVFEKTRRERLAISLNIENLTSTIDPHLGMISPSPDQLRIWQIKSGTTITSDTSRAVFDFTLPLDELEERARRFFEYDRSKPFGFDPLLNMNSMAGRSVISSIQYFYSLLTSDVGVLQNPIMAASSRDFLFTSILSQLPHSFRTEDRVRKWPNVHTAIVHNAEEYMRDRAADGVSIADLSNAVGCSERSLFASFQKIRNESPLNYLRNIRLDRARQDLVIGDTSVTDIAFKWGFSNLGRFSKLYAEKFEEKPSETLMRRRINPVRLPG
ncbi:MAG: helix-turn-helix transcriptional regulator [Pseudomonadota bacterium]